jgi:tetratricopeptide (TPR) repeat protein
MVDVKHNQTVEKNQLPLLNCSLIIREDYFEQIDKLFDTTKCIVIQAASGLGKTILAEQYAHRATNQKKTYFVHWFNAGSHEKLVINYLIELNRQLALFENLKSVESNQLLINKINNHIKSKADTKYLFIFDNIENTPEYLSLFVNIVRNLPDNVKIIVLTRESELEFLREFEFQSIELKLFNKSEATQLLYNLIGEKLNESNNLESIIKASCNNNNNEFVPYKFKNIISFIKYFQNEQTLEDLIERINAEGYFQLRSILLEHLKANCHCEYEIIKCLAFIEADFISLDFLLKLTNLKREEIEKAIKTLDMLSIIEFLDENRQFLSINRQTQDELLIFVEKKSNIPALKTVYEMLLNTFILNLEGQTNELSQNITRCVLHLTRFLEKFVKFGFKDVDHLKKEEILCDRVTEIFENMKCFGRALEFKMKSLDLIRKIHNESNLMIADKLHGIGVSYLNMGIYKTAIDYLKESLELKIKLLDENHASIADSLNCIGNCYSYLNNSTKCLEYLNKALEMKMKILKPLNPSFADILNDIGSACHNFGQYKKGIEYLNKCLEIKQQIYEANHTSIGETLNSIGLCYQDLGEYELAHKNYTKAIEIYSQSKQANNSNIGKVFNNLGNNYVHLGNYKKSIECYNKAIDIFNELYEPTNTRIAETLNNIGLNYYYLGEYRSSAEYLNNSLKLKLKIYSENHPSIANTLNNLGLNFFNLGEFKVSNEYFFKTLNIYFKVYDINHPRIADTLNNIAISFTNFGEYKVSIEYLNRALEIKNKIYEPDHPSIAESLNNIGLNYFHLGEFSNSINYFNRALEIFKKVYTNDHPSLAEAIGNIGFNYFGLDENEKAIEYLKKSLEIKQKVYEPYHPSIGETMYRIAIVYLTFGDHKSSYEYLKKSYEINLKVFEPNHPKIKHTKMMLENLKLYLDINQNDIQLKHNISTACAIS